MTRAQPSAEPRPARSSRLRAPIASGKRSSRRGCEARFGVITRPHPTTAAAANQSRSTDARHGADRQEHFSCTPQPAGCPAREIRGLVDHLEALPRPRPLAGAGGAGRRVARSQRGRCGRPVSGGIGGSRALHVVAARSRDSRYGARYFAAVLVGGNQVGFSLISELDPCSPVMCALRYRGLRPPKRTL